MSRTTLVLPQHVAKTALVYVRQSTTKQVLQNQESLRRQYQLVDAAVRLGWPQARTCVIDEDLGLSGTSSTTRQGFQRLVAAISLGEVGIILVTEVSRLSHLNSDWHRVIELCAVFETLIADEDGLYDPSNPNDRLVLGLKGTLFSAELHIIRARMRGGLLGTKPVAAPSPSVCRSATAGCLTVVSSRTRMSKCVPSCRRCSSSSACCRQHAACS